MAGHTGGSASLSGRYPLHLVTAISSGDQCSLRNERPRVAELLDAGLG